MTNPALVGVEDWEIDVICATCDINIREIMLVNQAMMIYVAASHPYGKIIKKAADCNATINIGNIVLFDFNKSIKIGKGVYIIKQQNILGLATI